MISGYFCASSSKGHVNSVMMASCVSLPSDSTSTPKPSCIAFATAAAYALTFSPRCGSLSRRPRPRPFPACRPESSRVRPMTSSLRVDWRALMRVSARTWYCRGGKPLRTTPGARRYRVAGRPRFPLRVSRTVSRMPWEVRLER